MPHHRQSLGKVGKVGEGLIVSLESSFLLRTCTFQCKQLKYAANFLQQTLSLSLFLAHLLSLFPCTCAKHELEPDSNEGTVETQHAAEQPVWQPGIQVTALRTPSSVCGEA